MKEISFEIKIPQWKFSRKRKFQIKIVLSILVAAGAFFSRQQFDFTFLETIILAYFGFSIVWNLSSRIAAFFALFFLASCPVLIGLENDNLAEIFAVCAYYFLVITVVNEIIDINTGKKVLPKTIEKRPVDNFSGQAE